MAFSMFLTIMSRSVLIRVAQMLLLVVVASCRPIATPAGGSVSGAADGSQGGPTQMRQLPLSTAYGALIETSLAMGDLAQCDRNGEPLTGSKLVSTWAQAQRASYQHIYMLGDLVYPNGTAPNFARCFDPLWGWARAITDPVPGNHERLAPHPDAAPYFEYFGSRVGRPAQPWYVLQRGSWRVFMLDSDIEGDLKAQQQAWLALELRKRENATECIMAAWHHTPFATSMRRSDQARMRSELALLARHGADLVLAGHEHFYERFQPVDDVLAFREQGTRVVLAGTGGAVTSNSIPLRESGAVLYRSAYGALMIRFFERGYQAEFIDVGNQVLDQFEAQCLPKGARSK